MFKEITEGETIEKCQGSSMSYMIKVLTGSEKRLRNIVASRFKLSINCLHGSTIIILDGMTKEMERSSSELTSPMEESRMKAT